jgi:hypothetical protein
MTQLSVVDAWKAAVGSLLCWPDCSLLWRWGRSMVELLLLLRLLLLKLLQLELWTIALVLLLLQSAQLTSRWGIHHAVLRRSTARTTTGKGGRHLPLLLIGLSDSLY